MAEIQRKDIITDEALQAGYELQKGFEAFLGTLEKVVGTAAQAGKKIAGTTSLPGVKRETEQLTTAQKELDKVQKQIAIQQARNNEAYLAEQRALAAVKQELKEKIALGNLDAKSINAQNASLKQLEAALAKNIRAYSLLKTEEERTSAAGQQLVAVITKQNAESIKLSERLGDNRKKVGDYTGGILQAWQQITNLKKANLDLISTQSKLARVTTQDKEAFNQLNVAIQNNLTKIQQYNGIIVNAKQSTIGWLQSILGAAGLIGGIYGVITAVRSFITVNKELEKSLSTLQALTGAGIEDLKFYKTEAIAIGVETKRSAKDVVEAFKLIGGARPELLANKEALAAVTREAIILANASGIELKDAADALGGALNQLQLNASDAGRAVNAYAAGAKEGAAEIPDINEAFKSFGAVLKANNGSIEEGVGLIEVLASRQIKGAEAGTALRNVLLALSAVDVLPKAAQKQMAKFGVDLKIVADTTLPLSQRLKELGKIAGDSSALVKVFGKENFVAGNIVLNNVKLFDELTKKVTGTDEAYRQAAVATDNFQGDLDEAASTTSALIAEIGDKTQSMLRAVVQSYTVFVNVLRGLPSFFKENQATMLSLAGAVVLLNKNTIVTTANTLRMAAAVQFAEIKEKAAIVTTRAFYATLTANPFGLLLVGITAVIAAIALYDKTSARSNYIQKESVAINDDLDDTLKSVTETREKLNTSVEDYLKMSKEEQIDLQVEAIYRRQQAEELLGVTLARIDDLKAQAAELTLWQQTKAGLSSLVLGYAGATAAAVEYSEANKKVIDDQFADKLKAIQDEILKYKDFLKYVHKSDEQETERAGKAEKDNSFKLQKFRIEEAIKAQELIRDAVNKGFDDRYKAELEAEKLRERLTNLEMNHKLAAVKITHSEQILAEEEYQAQLKDITRKSEDERTKLVQGREDATRKVNEAIIKDSIQANDNILHYEFATIDQRNEALTNMVADKKTLLDLNYEREQAAAKGNKERLEELQAEYNTDSLKLAKELSDGLNKNFFDVFDQSYGNALRANQQSTDAQMKSLNDAYVNGEMTAKQFQGRRLTLEIANNKLLMQATVDFLKEKMDTFKGSETDRLKIAAEISNAEIALAQYTADEKLKAEQAFNNAARNLQNTAFSSAATISQNITNGEVQRLDQKISKLKEASDAELALAGDNAEAKKVIAQNTAQEEKKLQDEKRRLQRKQAQFEKALALTQAIVNIAQGITQAFGEYPYPVAIGIAALIAAAGALEIGTIASAPIPSYAVGTENHPGGPAIVGEQGPELVTTPRGKSFLTPSRATKMNLEAGSRVFTSKETVKILAMGAFAKTDYSPISNGSVEHMEQMFDKLGERMASSNKSSNVDYMRHMAIVYSAKKEHERFIKIQRSISMGRD